MMRHHAASLNATLIGERDEKTNLALFRGIPYASVPARWQHSSVIDQLSDPFDARHYGPRCVQEEGQILVSGGVNDPTPGDDEFACLNLNIASPIDVLVAEEKASLLPVMVWIHGGAFKSGANSVSRYRPQELCSLAIQDGQPIVLVQINYRLGPFGFAASSDLAEEAGDMSSMGNYGLIDQRNAFRWVQHHIRDFGGDPDNVTAFGISAGSASIYFHILGGDPLFDRAICMSGASPSLGPLPFKIYEAAWNDLCVRAGIQSDSDATSRIEKLRQIPAEDILSLYTREAISVCAGAAGIPSSWKIQSLSAATSRCKSLVLGDSRVEAIIFDALSDRIPYQEFLARVQRVFRNQVDVDVFLDTFGFRDDMSTISFRDAMRHFLSVALFQYPNFLIANTSISSDKLYLYHFEEPSPYPGPTHGLPYHGQCALTLYNNESAEYAAPLRHTAREMARLWTAFAHGKEPWEPYPVKKQFMRLGPDGECEMHDVESDQIRDYRYLSVIDDKFASFMTLAQSVLHQRVLEDLMEQRACC